jgi:geranylgeranyl pyrophosphate synthase
MDKALNDFYFDKDYIYDLVHNFSPDTFNGGNHKRTLIITELASELGISEFHIAPYARVIELIHNATLIHDDVIDESHTRRDNPTINSKLHNKKSILIGDYMLAKAINELTSFASNNIVAELSRTLKDLVNGEILQSFENENLTWSKDKYYEIANNKTGSVLRWCLLTPLMIKEIEDPESLKNIELVAYKLGLIYQMFDDIKDFSSLSKKTPFLDIVNWNINIVLINLQNKNSLTSDILRTKGDMGLLTKNQRLEIQRAVIESLYEIEQISDEISKLLNNELNYSKFSEFVKSFIDSEVLGILGGIKDHGFKINDKVV